MTTDAPQAPRPPDEEERLELLHQLAILDTEQEQQFNELVELAASVCGVPAALVTFIDAERQWFKAKLGIDADETPRDIAFCSWAIADGEGILVVPDARQDDRFAQNPMVTDDPRFRFYAGVPLRPNGGPGVGTLCVVDTEARELDPTALALLRLIGNQATQLLEARLIAHQREEAVDLAQRLDERYRAVTETILHGVVVHGPGGEIEAANPAAARALGLTPEQLRGLTPMDPRWRAIHEDGSDYPGEEHPASITLRTGEVVRDAVIGVSTGDDLRWLLVASTPLPGHDGERDGAVATFVDITAERQLREDLARALELMTQNAQEHAAMTSSITHDLAAPTAATRIYASLLADLDPDLAIGDSAVSALIHNLQMNAVRAERLVTDLGTVSRRIGVASPLPNRADADVGVIVKRAVGLARRAVELELRHSDLRAEVDTVQIERIVDNLLSNADKYTPEGSTVTVTVDGDDDTITLVVDDDGPGVDAADRQRIFEPFVRSDQSDDVAGSGVGLFLVRRFASFHGGSVRCEPAASGGARFVVTLRRRRLEAQTG